MTAKQRKMWCVHSIWIYALGLWVLMASIDFNKAFAERSKYLLGIFYNGKFENYNDGVVYFDYMRRHEPNNPDHRQKLGYCYQQLGDMDAARKYQGG